MSVSASRPRLSLGAAWQLLDLQRRGPPRSWRWEEVVVVGDTEARMLMDEEACRASHQWERKGGAGPCCRPSIRKSWTLEIYSRDYFHVPGQRSSCQSWA